ncbi:hypothetical protein O181_052343 [Austropuccinia psidii MF-1]|uniref:Integrase catalytic domain-containing protein n=1 Tax=Austropuccinia psidii MF-1 TaxID=1389203 RepID=A0A9Q3E2F6_9BASI|nr:hypothetical protein [Austropuccinia psidii MF-1]
MDWVTALPPSGDQSHNACLVIQEGYTNTPIFLPCHKDDTSMDTALFLWSRIISHTGLFRNLISDRDPKLTSALWTNLHRFFGTKLSFSTEYHPQTDGLEERMIQTLGEMIRRFCNYELEFKDSDGFTHDIMLVKVKHHAKQSMNDAFDYAKQKWDKSHKVPDFKVGDLALVSTLNFNKIKGPNKLKDSYVGPFVIVALQGTNAVQVELSGELENKHPTLPVSLIKPYQPADKELFPLKNTTPLTVPAVEQSEDKKIKKVIRERRLRVKNKREYCVRYRNPVHED